MERRAFFSVIAGAAACIALPVFAEPLSCIGVRTYSKPIRLSQVPYSVGGAPTQDAPDLLVETWKYQDKTIVFCRWPGTSEQDISDAVVKLFERGDQ